MRAVATLLLVAALTLCSIEFAWGHQVAPHESEIGEGIAPDRRVIAKSVGKDMFIERVKKGATTMNFLSLGAQVTSQGADDDDAWDDEEVDFPLAEGFGERTFTRYVNFTSPYVAPPVVKVFVSQFGLVENTMEGRKVPLRIDAYASKVTPNGFDLNVRTWDASQVREAKISWTAYGQDPARYKEIVHIEKTIVWVTEQNEKLKAKQAELPPMIARITQIHQDHLRTLEEDKNRLKSLGEEIKHTIRAMNSFHSQETTAIQTEMADLKKMREKALKDFKEFLETSLHMSDEIRNKELVKMRNERRVLAEQLSRTVERVTGRFHVLRDDMTQLWKELCKMKYSLSGKCVSSRCGCSGKKEEADHLVIGPGGGEVMPGAGGSMGAGGSVGFDSSGRPIQSADMPSTRRLIPHGTFVAPEPPQVAVDKKPPKCDRPGCDKDTRMMRDEVTDDRQTESQRIGSKWSPPPPKEGDKAGEAKAPKEMDLSETKMGQGVKCKCQAHAAPKARHADTPGIVETPTHDYKDIPKDFHDTVSTKIPEEKTDRFGNVMPAAVKAAAEDIMSFAIPGARPENDRAMMEEELLQVAERSGVEEGSIHQAHHCHCSGPNTKPFQIMMGFHH